MLYFQWPQCRSNNQHKSCGYGNMFCLIFFSFFSSLFFLLNPKRSALRRPTVPDLPSHMPQACVMYLRIISHAYQLDTGKLSRASSFACVFLSLSSILILEFDIKRQVKGDNCLGASNQFYIYSLKTLKMPKMWL